MSTLDKNSILKILKDNQSSIRALGVVSLGLFGSSLTNSNRDDSDIDLLVDFMPDSYKFSNFIQLGDLLENLLNKKIDLLTRNSLSKYIGPYILESIEYVDFGN
jgi:predicted nucleotidyltransferase